MYLATRRQSNSTRFYGLIGTGVVIAAVGAVLVNMRETISVPLAPPPTQFLAIDDPPIVDPTPADLTPVDPTNIIPLDRIILTPPEVFWDKEPTAPVGPTVDYSSSPTPGTGITPSSTPVAPTIPGTRPVRIAGDAPEYPPASVRAHESGTTTLNLCISKAGRVTQANIATSSGSSRLDQAALQWIKRERFKPATENGQPVDMCNHSLAYVWELPKR